MKMQKDHYLHLKVMIKTAVLEAGKPVEEFAKAYQAAGHTAKRFRWDWLYAVPMVNRQEWFDRGIYAYLNDDHIDTALRSICKELNIPQWKEAAL